MLNEELHSEWIWDRMPVPNEATKDLQTGYWAIVARNIIQGKACRKEINLVKVRSASVAKTALNFILHCANQSDFRVLHWEI